MLINLSMKYLEKESGITLSIRYGALIKKYLIHYLKQRLNY